MQSKDAEEVAVGDVRFAKHSSKQVSRSMAKPTQKDVVELKLIIGYLNRAKNAPEMQMAGPTEQGRCVQ